MPDYRGYGKSNGAITSEDQLYKDMQLVYDYLKQSYDENQIVIIGYSLGTSFATYLSSRNQPKEIILIAPFKSIVDVAWRKRIWVPSLLVKYKLDNATNLKTTKCPVSILYSCRDKVVPCASTKSLATVPKQAEFIEIKGVSHRRLIFSDQMRAIVEENIKN